ncbi:MAG: glycosyltransferase family 4 protein [Candidatus Omnitrophica bacterium]|nr:glycosyltransferase family 4 protein [Candidatus Omnitrophota bacterium]
MKKIVFVLTTYEIGGVSTVAKNLLDAWVPDRFKITLVVEKLAARHNPVDARVNIIDLGMTAKKDILSKATNMIRHISAMRKAIISESPDAVISFGAQANCLTLLALFRSAPGRPRIVISEHSEFMFIRTVTKGLKYTALKNIYRILMSFLYHRADAIVAVSEVVGQRVRKLPFVDRDKVKVIYNPVNADKIAGFCVRAAQGPRGQDGLPRIGAVSRLSQEKGIHFLIEAFKLLLDKIDARLIVIGDGPEKAHLEEMARSLGAESKIAFTGWAEDPIKYMATMDIFVLPSIFEGLPNSILEAMACGVPVIASDLAGGVREIITNRVNGILIAPSSAPAISEAVYDLLTDREKMQRIARKGLETVKRFDIGLISREYDDLLFGNKKV